MTIEAGIFPDGISSRAAGSGGSVDGLSPTGAGNGPTGETIPAGSREEARAEASAPLEGQWPAAGLPTIARVVFILLALLTFAYFARPVLIPVLLAWVASLSLEPPVRWLKRCGISTPFAAGLVVGVFVIVLGLAAVRLGRPAAEWLSEAPENLPHLREKFRPILQPAARFSEAATRVGNLGAEETAGHAQAVEVKDNRVAKTVFTWTGGVVAGAAETVALLFLFLASGDVFLLKLVRVAPRLRAKKRVVEITREVHRRISGYLFSVGLINLGFGIVAGTALHLLGLPNAVMWGGIVTAANFIPYIGPVLAMVSVGFASLLQFDTLEQGLLPPASLLILHLIEANAVTPFVLGRRFALNPLIIFVTLMFGLWLWGIAGALLAGPLLVTAKVIAEGIPSLAFAAEFLAPPKATETSE